MLSRKSERYFHLFKSLKFFALCKINFNNPIINIVGIYFDMAYPKNTQTQVFWITDRDALSGGGSGNGYPMPKSVFLKRESLEQLHP